MDSNVENRGTYLHLRPSGRIDSNTATEFDASVMAAIEQRRNLLISFQEVPYITSAGIRVVMVAAKRASTTGCKLILCGMNDVVRNIFDISGFSKILAIYADEAEAVANEELGQR